MKLLCIAFYCNKSNDGSRPATDRRFEADCPLMFLEDRICYVESQTGSALSHLGREKRFPQPGHNCLVHAVAFIPDRNSDTSRFPVVGCLNMNSCLLAWKGLQGIHDQVDDNLLYLLAVTTGLKEGLLQVHYKIIGIDVNMMPENRGGIMNQAIDVDYSLQTAFVLQHVVSHIVDNGSDPA